MAHNLIASYVVFVLLVGTAGYAMARLLTAVLPLSARSRQLLYASVMALPLTAFVMDIAHWTNVCSSYAAHIIDVLRFSVWSHGPGLTVLTLSALLLYSAYLLSLRPANRSNSKLSANAGYHQRVGYLLSELGAAEQAVRIYRTSYPMACVVGLSKPFIYLSNGMLEVMDDRELKAVLAHELAHIKRKDNVLNLMVQILKHLTFFSPVTYLSAAKYAIAREEAADDLAAGIIGESADLASALVKIIRRISGYARVMQPVFGYSSFLESELALHRAERIMSEAYKQPYNTLVEQSLLFVVAAVVPMLFC